MTTEKMSVERYENLRDRTKRESGIMEALDTIRACVIRGDYLVAMNVYEDMGWDLKTLGARHSEPYVDEDDITQEIVYADQLFADEPELDVDVELVEDDEEAA